MITERYWARSLKEESLSVTRALVALTLVATGTSCDGDSRNTSESGSAIPDYGAGVLVATVCRDAESGDETGRYLFSEMNATLARCPGIAAKLPFRSVEHCDQAGLFVAARREYSSQNPGVDCNITPDFTDIAFMDDGVESHSSAMLADPDYDSQFPETPSPIVQISDLIMEHGELFERSSCSGTFIAKNWILTAAHCFYDDDGKVQPGYRTWLVRWGGDGVPNKVAFEHAFNALQIPHPTTIKRNVSRFYPEQRDLALLYLPVSERHDRFLPPDISTYGGELAADATDRLSAPDPDFLQSGWGQALELNITPVPIVGAYEEGKVLATGAYNPEGTMGNGHRGCKGDSGGPLYWRSGKHPIVAAVAHAITGVTEEKTCGEPDSTVFYYRVDNAEVRTWINSEMAQQHGETDKLKDPATSARAARCRPDEDDDSFYKCWRPPCASQDSCLSDEICTGSAAAYAKEVCSNAICGGGCSCVVGSCIANWAVKPISP